METSEVASARHRPSRPKDGEPTHIRGQLTDAIVQLSGAALADLANALTDEQVSEIIHRRVDASQLEQLWLLKRSHTPSDSTYADELEWLTRESDPATAQAWLDLQQAPHKVATVAALWRALGVDDDIIGAWLNIRLVENGIESDRAERMVIRAGVDWAPRADSDRWGQIAAAMIRDDGFAPDQVRDAITNVRAREVVAA